MKTGCGNSKNTNIDVLGPGTSSNDLRHLSYSAIILSFIKVALSSFRKDLMLLYNSLA